MDDITLHDYPKGHSQSLRGPEFLLPVNNIDLIQRELDVSSNGLQVAKLDPLSGWRLWVTHVWYVGTIESHAISYSYFLIMVADSPVLVAAYFVGYLWQAWRRAS